MIRVGSRCVRRQRARSRPVGRARHCEAEIAALRKTASLQTNTQGVGFCGAQAKGRSRPAAARSAQALAGAQPIESSDNETHSRLLVPSAVERVDADGCAGLHGLCGRSRESGRLQGGCPIVRCDGGVRNKSQACSNRRHALADALAEIGRGRRAWCREGAKPVAASSAG